MCSSVMGTAFWLIIGLLITYGKALGCDKPHVRCVNESTFTLDVTIFDRTFDFGVVLNCPEYHFCHERTDTPCMPYPPTTTAITDTDEIATERHTITTTSITTTVTPPECRMNGYYPATKVNQYYECIRVFWWYKVTLKTCKTGYIYSTNNPPCNKSSNDV
ncbi:PREDICTED: uncharacterized protein LOC108567915 [Nicrophorus vespilloides]|uniref:Uncharacterized protein LOC108567915 n=1 Tax=Nicrophorus vespilloides TaxID=110193 RepID=A0ABM1NBJ1_NICVS|nr:PREDICTED: uncharacterized protein LOC108567915 [Nicrophorus vespilloides]